MYLLKNDLLTTLYEEKIMSNINERIDELVKNIQQERDELMVKLQLAKMESSDEWKKIEAKLEKLDDKAEEVADASLEASKEVGAAINLLAEEIRDAFVKISKHF